VPWQNPRQTEHRDGYADLCRHQRCRHAPHQLGSERHPILQLQNGSGNSRCGNYTNLDSACSGLAGRRYVQCDHPRPPATAAICSWKALPSGERKSIDNLNIFYTRAATPD
jgi:hypothetical protein